MSENNKLETYSFGSLEDDNHQILLDGIDTRESAEQMFNAYFLGSKTPEFGNSVISNANQKDENQKSKIQPFGNITSKTLNNLNQASNQNISIEDKCKLKLQELSEIQKHSLDQFQSKFDEIQNCIKNIQENEQNEENQKENKNKNCKKQEKSPLQEELNKILEDFQTKSSELVQNKQKMTPSKLMTQSIRQKPSSAQKFPLTQQKSKIQYQKRISSTVKPGSVSKLQSQSSIQIGRKPSSVQKFSNIQSGKQSIEKHIQRMGKQVQPGRMSSSSIQTGGKISTGRIGIINQSKDIKKGTVVSSRYMSSINNQKNNIQKK